MNVVLEQNGPNVDFYTGSLHVCSFVNATKLSAEKVSVGATHVVFNAESDRVEIVLTNGEYDILTLNFATLKKLEEGRYYFYHDSDLVSIALDEATLIANKSLILGFQGEKRMVLTISDATFGAQSYRAAVNVQQAVFEKRCPSFSITFYSNYDGTSFSGLIDSYNDVQILTTHTEEGVENTNRPVYAKIIASTSDAVTKGIKSDQYVLAFYSDFYTNNRSRRATSMYKVGNTREGSVYQAALMLSDSDFQRYFDGTRVFLVEAAQFIFRNTLNVTAQISGGTKIPLSSIFVGADTDILDSVSSEECCYIYYAHYPEKINPPKYTADYPSLDWTLDTEGRLYDGEVPDLTTYQSVSFADGTDLPYANGVYSAGMNVKYDFTTTEYESYQWLVLAFSTQENINLASVDLEDFALDFYYYYTGLDQPDKVSVCVETARVYDDRYVVLYFNFGAYLRDDYLLSKLEAHLVKYTTVFPNDFRVYDFKLYAIDCGAISTTTSSSSSSSTTSSTSSCVTGNSILKTPNGEILAKDAKIGDLVLGKDLQNDKYYEIQEVIVSEAKDLLRLYFSGEYLDCSGTHCVFTTDGFIFKHATDLKIGDYIKTTRGVKKIIGIEQLAPDKVYQLILKDKGTYYANGVLGHSQFDHPAMIADQEFRAMGLEPPVVTLVRTSTNVSPYEYNKQQITFLYPLGGKVVLFVYVFYLRDDASSDSCVTVTGQNPTGTTSNFSLLKSVTLDSYCSVKHFQGTTVYLKADLFYATIDAPTGGLLLEWQVDVEHTQAAEVCGWQWWDDETEVPFPLYACALAVSGADIDDPIDMVHDLTQSTGPGPSFDFVADQYDLFLTGAIHQGTYEFNDLYLNVECFTGTQWYEKWWKGTVLRLIGNPEAYFSTCLNSFTDTQSVQHTVEYDRAFYDTMTTGFVVGVKPLPSATSSTTSSTSSTTSSATKSSSSTSSTTGTTTLNTTSSTMSSTSTTSSTTSTPSTTTSSTTSTPSATTSSTSSTTSTPSTTTSSTTSTPSTTTSSTTSTPSATTSSTTSSTTTPPTTSSTTSTTSSTTSTTSSTTSTTSSTTSTTSSTTDTATCVALGTLIKNFKGEDIPVEVLKIGDWIMGLDGNGNLVTYQVEGLIYAKNEPVYTFEVGSDTLRCSESHCVYSTEYKTFKQAWKLQKRHKVKGYGGDKEITNIKIGKPETVVAIKLKDNGCYFANGILSHSQDFVPAFGTINTQDEFQAMNTESTGGDSKSNISTTASDFTSSSTTLDPMSVGNGISFEIPNWKYASANVWKKAVYLVDNDLGDESTGYIVDQTDLLQIEFTNIPMEYIYIKYISPIALKVNGNPVVLTNIQSGSNFLVCLVDVSAIEGDRLLLEISAEDTLETFVSDCRFVSAELASSF